MKIATILSTIFSIATNKKVQIQAIKIQIANIENRLLDRSKSMSQRKRGRLIRRLSKKRLLLKDMELKNV